MSIQSQFLFTVLSLISGVIAIFLANRIMRKYPLNFLSSYFYFLIFILIFSVYSVIGSQTISRVLLKNNASETSTRSVEGMLISLGIPFLVLALYMFLRLSYEFFKSELPRYFVILYFSVFALSFIGYAMLNIDIAGFENLSFFPGSTQLKWMFTGLLILVFGYALTYILIRTGNLNDVNQRIAYRWFVLWYTLIILISLVSLHLGSVHRIFGLIFISVFTGFHLLPVLFLGIYLQRFYVERTEDSTFMERLQLVVAKYDISNRETEIIELICKGMSNQEISDSLYISLQTVKDHVHRIFVKTGVKNRVQLTNLLEDGKT